MLVTKKVLKYVGSTNNKHAYFMNKNEDTAFEDVQFIDIPFKDWDAMGSPVKITVTVEVGDTLDG